MPRKGQKQSEEAIRKIREALSVPKVQIVCVNCGGLSKPLFPFRAKTQRFCSLRCKALKEPNLKPHKWTEEDRKKHSEMMTKVRATKKDWKILRGSEQWNWKGQEVSYRALHRWVEGLRGRPFFCEDCGRNEPPKGKGLKRNYFQWANISGHYLRILEDWKQLCYKCHKQFDGARHKANA